jgi:hypothetical protein
MVSLDLDIWARQSKATAAVRRSGWQLLQDDMPDCELLRK